MNRRSFLVILVLAFTLRAAWAIAVPVQPLSDGHAYDVLAQNIVNGTGYGFQPGDPNAYWPPGTSFVYALVYFIFGHTYLSIVLLNLALGVFIVAAAMQLSARWFTQRQSLVTGLILALWLNLIEFTTILASELLFCALLLAALLAWTHPAHGWQRRAVGAGVLLAAACYVRPIGLGLPIVFLALEWLRAQQQGVLDARKHMLTTIAVMGLVMALVIAPWSIRNTATFGQFVLLSTNGGAAFWGGNNPESTGEGITVQPKFPTDNMGDQDTYLTTQTFDYIRMHPLDFGAGILKKLVLTHSRESIGIAWNEAGLVARWGGAVILPLKIANAAFWFGVLVLALAGIAFLYRQNGWTALVRQPALALWGYFALTHAIILAQDRYHMPSTPAIAMLAAYALVCVAEAWQVRAGLRADAVQPNRYASTVHSTTERVEV